MEMKRIEAETLEEAYSKAAQELECSVTEINYEIVQHPNAGMMGLFRKKAIIIAVKKSVENSVPKEEKKRTENKQTVVSKNSSITVTPKKREDDVKEELNAAEPEVKTENIVKRTTESFENVSTVLDEKDEIVDDFFNDEVESRNDKKVAEASTQKSKEVSAAKHASLSFDDDRDSPENKALSLEIENKVKKLISVACFEIDTVEVDVFNGIAHIFIDGEDAALVIGKEGYRYNALSYMLFNWINSHYDLYIKLEIAEFIQAQEEMIENYLKPISEHIIEHGKGKTKPLDGILVQIALEKLRAMFPNKYIAIKTGKDGKKFILINNFNNQKQI